MTDPKLKRRMSPMDAFFLFADSEEAPMTIGFVGIFEGRVPLRTFRSRLNSRLHLIPRYRQFLVHTPLNVALPTWEDDPEFDLDYHVRQVQLGKGVSEQLLFEHAEELFEGPMDTARPLWEVVLVPNLVGGRTGIICRVHHCMVDGIGGIGLMHVVFDVVPNPKPVRKRPYVPQPVPERASLLYDAIWDNATEGVEHWTQFRRTLKTFSRGRSKEQLTASLTEFGSQLGDLLTPRRRLPFNQPFNGARRFAFAELSFAEARAVKAVTGSTINDVALATLAGAMTEYLDQHGHNTLGEELAVVCPVNIRDANDRTLGNRISFLPVKVPLDLDDPLERLQVITARTGELKSRGVPEMVHLFFSALQALPVPLQKAALNGLNSSQYRSLVDKIPQIPPGNLICTNVPGPQIPLYSCGKRLQKYYPLLPLTLEMGISCGITSYEQTLYFSFMGDGNCAPDIDLLRDCHQRAFARLRDAASVETRAYLPLRYASTRVPEGRIVPLDRSEVAAMDARRSAVGNTS